jgi:4-alpha-glucanotransferase
VSLPLHALHTKRSWGVGDLSDLEALIGWTREQGGALVATLPMLAQFLHTLHEPSPYSPASKLFWNELYADPRRLPEAAAPEVAALLGSPGFRDEVAGLRRGRLVDHDSAYLLKRRVLEGCLRAADADPDRRRALDRHLREHPLLGEYARFRAVCERRDQAWWEWPARARGTDHEPGTLRPVDGDRGAERYHAYAQWVTEQQVEAISPEPETGTGLYLDMPLGTDPAGFDVWRFRSTFALGAAGGAPPDLFFSRGQDWSFPPPHPERIRRDGHAYLRRTLRHVLRHAGVLRIDHVMGLHRLYWVPAGMEPTSGAYVRYPAEEQFAVIALETSRTGTEVVGEDLGTVPGRIHRLMRRHGVRRSYVMQFSVRADPVDALTAPEPGMFAAVNTHDMPPFAAFWRALDVNDRAAMGLLDDEEAARERKERAGVRESLVAWLVERGWVEPFPAGADLEEEAVGLRVLAGCLRVLAAGDAGLLVVNLEDLWGETRPQNVPGTSTERPNWRLRSRHGLDQIRGMAAVVEVLRVVDRARREARA